jgi:phosphoribosyl 1,2-cyclic phosphodiesterase
VTTGKGTIGLTFLGTRGEIALRTRRHQRHSSLLVLHNGARVMIDCGSDWSGRLRTIAPTAIVLTHAHPDHAAGLADGAPCPVYATRETLELLCRFPVSDLRKIPLRKSVTIAGIQFKASPVCHSVRAPAVGYRVSANGGCFFYLPDVADLPDVSGALGGIDLYIGDGATVQRSMVRSRHGTLIGHAPITTQLRWCENAGVRHAIFTHCGSPIVRGDQRALNTLIRRLGRERGVDASLACDGDRISLGGGRSAGPPWMRRNA